MGPSDTSPEAERFLIEGYRRMSPSQKLERVFSLNRMLEHEDGPLATSPCARTRQLAMPGEGLATRLPPTADEMETLDRRVRPRGRDVVEPVRPR